MRYAFIPFCPHAPVSIEGILGFLVLPQVERLMKSCIDAITRPPVKVEAHMQVMFVCHEDQVVDLLQHLMVKIEDLILFYIPCPVERKIS